MEGAIRNLVGSGKVLNCMCGAFSDKWFDVSKKCGKEAEALQVEWGQPIRGEQIREKLEAGRLRRGHAHSQRNLDRRDERRSRRSPR